jgi:hypothetical protein
LEDFFLGGGPDFVVNIAQEEFGRLECFFSPHRPLASPERTFNICPSRKKELVGSIMTPEGFKKGHGRLKYFGIRLLRIFKD